MLLAMVDDIRVILVKLADRLHNMRTLQHLPEERRIKIAQETRDIYAPIANRLGMSKIKNELEELAFKYLEPKAYEALGARVEARRRATEGMIEELKKTISAKLAEAQVPVIAIDGRIKRLFSIHQKLKRQKIDLEQVYDLVALRIVTDSVQGLLRGARHHPPDVVAGAGPDQGLHRDAAAERVSVAAHVGHRRARLPFEVQIRTEEMHRMAEEGIAAHWKYKEGRVGAGSDERYFLWLRQLLEWQQEVRDPQEFLQNLKIELYPEEVYIFTPKGEVKSLPRGATPVDFAYAIHTDVGHQCVGARVNGKMVPLRTQLRNGDIVEIMTAAGHKPSRDWLNFVVDLACARTRSGTSSRPRRRSAASSSGRKLFEKEARRFGLNVKTLTESEGIAKSLAEYGVRSRTRCSRRSATASCRRSVLAKLVPQEQLKEAAESGHCLGRSPRARPRARRRSGSAASTT